LFPLLCIDITGHFFEKAEGEVALFCENGKNLNDRSAVSYFDFASLISLFPIPMLEYNNQLGG